ncbi:putative interleukin-2 receptor subunit beta [Scophthalmus maximus]|uniref:Putative interleukin-2 receptor subunit beta n=1 Tax=Scophthalmus maximus TaxID=52904 RepID=A0A2U9CS55_SCOMX|nr:putative interleukin-2 receptor subunit beta [Scophthalmus maximus]
MSRIVAMAMEMSWPLCVLIVLFSADAANSHKRSQGLSCVNDFVNNVNCTWNSTPVAPGVNCWIHGTKKIWFFENNTRHSRLMTQSCKLKQHKTSPPGCSFSFENEEFNFFEVNNISVECNGKFLENLTNYRPRSHIKMNPPGVPAVSSAANETRISWSPGSLQSGLIQTFDFQVEIKLKKQTRAEVSTLYTQEQQLRIPAWKLKGPCQVRVRVKPSDRHNSHWSDWSPKTSWTGATDVARTPTDQDWLPMQLVMWAVLLTVGFLVATLVFHISCVTKGHLKLKPVPNPSKYFPTLHSVHGGHLKNWLNPQSASETFFTVQPCDHISPVEVGESWKVVPSTSPSSSSTIALLHISSYPSAGSDTSRAVRDSSSCFSNMGYFMSSYSSSVARSDTNPAYFTYQDEFHNDPNFHLALCPSLTCLSAYESLKREPQSPDSGFGFGQEDEEDKKNEKGTDVEGEGVSDDLQSSPLLVLPLHPPPRVCPPSSAPAPPHLPSLNQTCSDSQEEDAPVVDACENYAAWPIAGTMCRSSSMPSEPGKTGYLTLKELQTTFSNKSI